MKKSLFLMLLSLTLTAEVYRPKISVSTGGALIGLNVQGYESSLFSMGSLYLNGEFFLSSRLAVGATIGLGTNLAESSLLFQAYEVFLKMYWKRPGSVQEISDEWQEIARYENFNLALGLNAGKVIYGLVQAQRDRLQQLNIVLSQISPVYIGPSLEATYFFNPAFGLFANATIPLVYLQSDSSVNSFTFIQLKAGVSLTF